MYKKGITVDEAKQMSLMKLYAEIGEQVLFLEKLGMNYEDARDFMISAISFSVAANEKQKQETHIIQKLKEMTKNLKNKIKSR